MFHLMMLLVVSSSIVSQSQDPAGAAAPAAVVDPTVRTSGSITSEALSAQVEVTYDAYGVPTVRASNRGDAYFAEGFVHAQNRFTQMDVLRRLSAGELAALAGSGAVRQDMQTRPYRLRAVAREVVANLDREDRATLKRYVEGVNAGLADLSVPPPEYAILVAKPEAWNLEDTILVMLSFSLMLEQSADREMANAAIFEALPLEVREFLFSPISRFDAPIPGFELRKPSIPRIPPREVISLRDMPERPPAKPFNYEQEEEHGEEPTPGSNNWAVSGALTHDGRAILASDPHLRLSLPGSWYRIRLEWPDHDIIGISLPGIPGVVMGSNGHVAWGFTNLTGDFQDLIALEIDEDDPTRYRTPEGWESFGDTVEVLEVAGGDPISMPLKTTRWGAVNGSYADKNGVDRPAVVEWAALHPDLVNIKLLEMEDAHTLDEALDTLGSWYGPAQNAAVADSEGRVGYTVTGFLPNRGLKDGRAPYGLWSEGDKSWAELSQGTRPRMAGADVDYVFTANNRTVDPRLARQLGYAWANPARARRIADVLMQTSDADEESMLALQMDPTTIGLNPWKKIILDVIPADEQDESLAAAREAILAWNSRADPDQVGITLLDDIRTQSLEDLSAAVAAWAREQGLGQLDEVYLHEEPYLRIIEDRPENWLPPGDEESWPEWIRMQVRGAVARGALRPWGEVNQVTLQSPFAELAPGPMRRMLEIESGPQAGYWNAPKVLAPRFGASARMVVSPSHEADGILLTPGGQSGNPLSPHYRSLNSSWLAGEPLPLLPGESVASFSLEPGSTEGVGTN